ncbi:MAG TPA: hypothetical protein VGB17_06920 [Pyrinomonadaceae bacterium]|jgi:hypothetical protein
MGLEDAEIVTAAEICGELYEAVQFNAGSLTAGQLASLRVDITTWNSIRDKHLNLKDVDLGTKAKRAAIRERVRRMLWFDDSSSVSIRMVRG